MTNQFNDDLTQRTSDIADQPLESSDTDLKAVTGGLNFWQIAATPRPQPSLDPNYWPRLQASKEAAKEAFEG